MALLQSSEKQTTRELLKELAQSLQVVRGNFETLQEQISPILSPIAVASVGEGLKSAEPSRSEIDSIIGELTAQVNYLKSDIYDLVERVHL